MQYISRATDSHNCADLLQSFGSFRRPRIATRLCKAVPNHARPFCMPDLYPLMSFFKIPDQTCNQSPLKCTRDLVCKRFSKLDINPETLRIAVQRPSPFSDTGPPECCLVFTSPSLLYWRCQHLRMEDRSLPVPDAVVIILPRRRPFSQRSFDDFQPLTPALQCFIWYSRRCHGRSAVINS